MPIFYRNTHADELVKRDWSGRADSINVDYAGMDKYKITVGTKGEDGEFIDGDACSELRFPDNKTGLEEVARQELRRFDRTEARKYNLYINGRIIVRRDEK